MLNKTQRNKSPIKEKNNTRLYLVSTFMTIYGYDIHEVHECFNHNSYNYSKM